MENRGTKTIEVIDRKPDRKQTHVYLSVGGYKYDGDTLTILDDKMDVLRTFTPDEFTGFKVNKAKP